MAHAKEPTPEQKAEEFDQSWEASRQAAESRDWDKPSQLPANPKTGSDDPDDGV